MQSQGFWRIIILAFSLRVRIRSDFMKLCISARGKVQALSFHLQHSKKVFIGFTVSECCRENVQNPIFILQWGSCVWHLALTQGSTAVSGHNWGAWRTAWVVPRGEPELAGIRSWSLHLVRTYTTWKSSFEWFSYRGFSQVGHCELDPHLWSTLNSEGEAALNDVLK